MTEPLILIEGLPGSGKSTLAHLLARHLVRVGRRARWYYEHAGDYPVRDTEATARMVRGEPYEPQVFEESCERWRSLTERIAADDETVILESAIFQPTVHLMLMAGLEEAQIREHAAVIATTIEPLAPVLIHLRPPDLEAALEHAMRLRGEWFGPFLESRIRESAFGRKHGLSGREGVLAYFTTYRALTDDLARTFPFRVLEVAVMNDGPEVRLASICRELGIASPPEEAVATEVDASPLLGRYRAPGSEEEMRVEADERGPYLGGDAPGRLLPLDFDTYEVLGTCVTIRFVRDAAGRAEALECRAPLAELPPIWTRIA